MYIICSTWVLSSEVSTRSRHSIHVYHISYMVYIICSTWVLSSEVSTRSRHSMLLLTVVSLLRYEVKHTCIFVSYILLVSQTHLPYTYTPSFIAHTPAIYIYTIIHRTHTCHIHIHHQSSHTYILLVSETHLPYTLSVIGIYLRYVM
jgi:hypothetical protein